MAQWDLGVLDAATHWITDDSHKLPIGRTASNLVDWILDHVEGFFDVIKDIGVFLIDGTTGWLVACPPLLFILAFTLLTYWSRRKLSLALLAAIGLLLILNLGYWKPTMETLSLVAWATLFALAVGIPIGIACAHRPWLFALVRPVLDVMQTLPTYVYLIPVVLLLGIGSPTGFISTVIYALPLPIRLTQLGISSAPTQLIEAGQAFGATKRQLLWKVELPSALPTIMAGFTQTIMASLSMVVIAGLVGAGGLGGLVVRALGQMNFAMGVESGLSIVILAILLDRIIKQPDTRRKA